MEYLDNLLAAIKPYELSIVHNDINGVLRVSLRSNAYAAKVDIPYDELNYMNDNTFIRVINKLNKEVSHGNNKDCDHWRRTK